MSKVFGLVLTGGGSRGAYQAGVLKGLSEISKSKSIPFKVICGVSAGAINGAFMAYHADNFKKGADELWTVWEKISSDKVYNTDLKTFMNIGSKVIRDLSFGGFFKTTKSQNLLDTAPLRAMLEDNIDFEKIDSHLKSGDLKALCVSATNYKSGSAISFYQTHDQVEDWVRSGRMSRRAKITSDHIMASSAIPIFFPPIELETSFFGDGCIRLNSPLSPAIHLGSEKLLVIGVRYQRSNDDVIRSNKEFMDKVLIADVAGVLLNAIFLDMVDADLERLNRINNTIKASGGKSNLRAVENIYMTPGHDLGSLMADEFDTLPRVLRYLFRGLGAEGQRGWDLLSYLAFESGYCKKLLGLGYNDTLKRADEIRTFMEE